MVDQLGARAYVRGAGCTEGGERGSDPSADLSLPQGCQKRARRLPRPVRAQTDAVRGPRPGRAKAVGSDDGSYAPGPPAGCRDRTPRGPADIPLARSAGVTGRSESFGGDPVSPRPLPDRHGLLGPLVDLCAQTAVLRSHRGAEGFADLDGAPCSPRIGARDTEGVLPTGARYPSQVPCGPDQAYALSTPSARTWPRCRGFRRRTCATLRESGRRGRVPALDCARRRLCGSTT